MSINWFPGHMKKAIDEMKESIKIVDIVVEVVDSRLPMSSRNYLLGDIAKDKPRIIVMNKYDLADNERLSDWKKYYEEEGYKVIYTNAQTGENVTQILKAIKEIGDKIYSIKYANKKVEITPIYRVMIFGIPNVGKSTIINKLSKKNSLKVSNKPGVTVKKQWIRLQDNIELMDTPGVLWPKLDENNAGVKLALTGNIKLEVLDAENLAIEGIKILLQDEKYKESLLKKYNLEKDDLNLELYEILEKMAIKRGCILKGNEIDYERISNIFLDEFKNGKIVGLVLDEIK